MTTSSSVRALLLWKYGAVWLIPWSGATSNFWKSSPGPGPHGGWAHVSGGRGAGAENTKPESNARPRSVVVRRSLNPSAKVNSNVRAFRAIDSGHGAGRPAARAAAVKSQRGGLTVSTGRGHADETWW